MRKTSRKEVARYGRRGDLVRVVEDMHRGAPVYRVLYRKADGRPSAAIYPRSRDGRKEALAFAEGFHDQRAKEAEPAPPAPLTVEQLWDRYVAANFDRFRSSTRRIYRDGWRPWQDYVGPHTTAEVLGWESMDGLRRALEARDWAVNTIRKTFGVIRGVYRWGQMTKAIGANDVGLYQYRVGKDRQPESPAEFTSSEFEAILDELPLTDGRRWRAHVAIGICGFQGVRQWAALHLQWDDIDFDQRILTWQAPWDKNGKTWVQPLRRPTIAVLAMAWDWREKMGYTGPWVLFAGNRLNKGETYTEGALWRSIVGAEQRAGIPHLRSRGAHGLRRLLAGNVATLTGDIKLAMDAIGDKDIRMARRYLKVRMGRVVEAFDRLDQELENRTKTGVEAASDGVA